MAARAWFEIHWYWRRGLRHPLRIGAFVATATLVQAVADACL